MQKTYDIATAKALLELACSEFEHPPYVIRDDGVHVSRELTDQYRSENWSGKVFDWTPACDMNWPGSPNPDIAPCLPIPFTADELAACMLDGLGQAIGEAMGAYVWEPLPADELEDRFSDRQRWIRDALADAYASAAEAQKMVGAYDGTASRHVQTLTEELRRAQSEANHREGVFAPGISEEEKRRRRARAAASLAELKEQVRCATDEEHRYWVAWRREMVRQLLAPRPEGIAGGAGAAVAPAGLAAEPLPADARRSSRRTWLDVAGTFVVGVMRSGQYATAKELFRALEDGAGGSDSPFDKGTGQHRGSLYVREIGKPLSLKTLLNNMSKLRELASR